MLMQVIFFSNFHLERGRHLLCLLVILSVKLIAIVIYCLVCMFVCSVWVEHACNVAVVQFRSTLCDETSQSVLTYSTVIPF